MTLLLDTHVLIWFATGNSRLGPSVRTAIRTDEVTVSAITVWEISIKVAAGRLKENGLRALLAAQDVPELAFTAAHGQAAGELPLHHRDPFDRALVAQARVEGLVLVTTDRALAQYDVALLDASR